MNLLSDMSYLMVQMQTFLRAKFGGRSSKNAKIWRYTVISYPLTSVFSLTQSCDKTRVYGGGGSNTHDGRVRP